MPGAARLNDDTTGHSDFPSTTLIEGSSNVMINGRPAVRVGDSIQQHCDPFGCHSGDVSRGSSSVFVNGRPKARIGDPISCGDIIDGGSGNVIVGG